MACTLPRWAAALLAIAAAATAGPPVIVPGSVRPLPGSAGGPPGFALLRSSLTPAEESARIDLEIALRMPQFAELQARVDRGERLSGAELHARYHPAPDDVARVSAWLQAQGFTIVDQSPVALFVTGTVAQAEAAFGVRFARVAGPDGDYTSSGDEPHLPSELAPLVLGVNGLQPHIHPHRHLVLSPASLSGNGPPFLPSQIVRAYGGTGLAQTGSGQTTAIVIDTFPSNSDLTTFWSYCGVPQSLANLAEIQVVSGTLPATSGEETLDAEWASSIAPGSNLRIYAVTNLSFVNIDRGYARVLADTASLPSLHALSLSYGAGELYVSPSQMATDEQYFINLVAKGVTVLVASGDGGSSPDTSGHANTGPVQVETPANCPHVTAVGGTTLTVDSGSGLTTSETAWKDGGGGQSTVFARPSWQSAAGSPSGSGRLVPDVAADADENTGGFLIWNNAGYIVGGTSLSAPIWAGFAALANQARAAGGASSLGLAATSLYPLAGTASFRDITSGSNGANGVYNAGPGFDLCTGLGTPILSALIPAVTPASGGIDNQGVDTPLLTPIARLALLGLLATAGWRLLRTRPLRS